MRVKVTTMNVTLEVDDDCTPVDPVYRWSDQMPRAMNFVEHVVTQAKRLSNDDN